MSYQKYMQKLIDTTQFSIEAIAHSLDLTIPAVKKILSGNVKNPSMQTIEKLAEMNNEKPIDIVQQILCIIPTEKDGLTKQEINYITTSKRYLCYLYLNGYNVEFNNHFTTLDGSELIFPGIATKKREPNNKILVDAFKSRSFIKSNGTPVKYDSLLDFLYPLFLISSINTFKRVDIVIGDELEDILPLVSLYSSHNLPFKFKLNIIHFDSLAGEIISTYQLS